MSLILNKINYIYGDGEGFTSCALKDINLVIDKNEFIGLVGHTGSGKSTLTQVLNGLLKASSGDMYFDEQNVYDEKYSLKELRQKVGLVFQYPEHQLFESTVLSDVAFGPKNLGLSKKESELRAFEALELVGMDPNLFYCSPLELSGGQKRRAAIAGVLAMKPEILILDEPTAGLDPQGRREILNLLKMLHEETKNTIILVSHSMEDVAEYADRVVVMNEGRIVYDDTPRNIFANYVELEALGLKAPEITYIMKLLQENGLAVDTSCITVDEGYESIIEELYNMRRM